MCAREPIGRRFGIDNWLGCVQNARVAILDPEENTHMHTRLTLSKLGAVLALGGCLVTGFAAKAALFDGIFAPGNWTPDPANDPTAVIAWLPNAGAPIMLAITNPSAQGTFTTAITVDGSLITTPGTLSFRYTMDAGDADFAAAAIQYNGGTTILAQTDPVWQQGTLTVNLDAGQDLSFVLSSSNPPGKKTPAVLLIDDWLWTPVPEPSVIASSVIVGLGVAGYAFRKRFARR